MSWYQADTRTLLRYLVLVLWFSIVNALQSVSINAHPASLSYSLPSDQQTNLSFHLISLPPLYSASIRRDKAGLIGAISPKCIRDLWQWKDKSLGDGRDFFVPRPRAIKALCSLLLQCSPLYVPDSFRLCNHTIEEVAVLSNCARMDILIISSSDMSINKCATDEQLSLDDTLRIRVASCFASQLKSYTENTKGSVWDTLGVGSILDLGTINEAPSIGNESDINTIARELVHVENLDDITRHLCKVAIGVADRPSRPDREILFRPFSSRDAHIMLQLKRTKELAVGNRVKLIVDASLQAGKRGRDPYLISELKELRKYGDSSRYPKALSDRASESVIDKVVEPTVTAISRKFTAMKSSKKIQELILLVEEFINENELSKEQCKQIKRLMHSPMMSLRKGETFDEAQFWLDLTLVAMASHGDEN